MAQPDTNIKVPVKDSIVTQDVEMAPDESPHPPPLPTAKEAKAVRDAEPPELDEQTIDRAGKAHEKAQRNEDPDGPAGKGPHRYPTV